MKDSIPTSAEFNVLNSGPTGASYFLLDSVSGSDGQELVFQLVKKGEVRASLKAVIHSDGSVQSLPNTPFGGIWVSGQIRSSELELFVNKILDELGKRKCSSFKLVQPPKPYEKYSDLIGHILFRWGFEVKNFQSHHFFLGKEKIKKQSLIFLKNQENTLKSKDLSILLGHIQDFSLLQDIRNWNSEKGYSILFDEKRLISQISQFRDRYFQISVFNQGHPIAHSIAVKLVPGSLYYYLSAICPHPGVSDSGNLMLQSLFQLAVKQNSEFIDLGSSESNSKLNHNLIFFKSRFSDDVSGKITWEYRF